MSEQVEQYASIVEAIIFASQQPVSFGQIELMLQEEERVIDRDQLKAAIVTLQAACEGRAIDLVELASGYQYRVKPGFAPWLAKLTEERPQRYSRALLETLALIVYRQPVTRAEIEEVRGVAVSSHILRTLIEREWVKIVGHKDVPGKPALLATTRAFLDYFNLKSLRDLPPLEAFINLDNAGEQLELLLSETEVPVDWESSTVEIESETQVSSDGEFPVENDEQERTGDENER